MLCCYLQSQNKALHVCGSSIVFLCFVSVDCGFVYFMIVFLHFSLMWLHVFVTDYVFCMLYLFSFVIACVL